MAGKTQKLDHVSNVLINAKKITEEKALALQSKAQKESISLIQFLVQENVLSAHELATLVSKELGVPLLNLDMLDKENLPYKLVSAKLIRQKGILPIFKRGDILFIAVDDPSDQAALKEIQFHTGLTVRSIVVDSDKLYKTIETTLNDEASEALGDFLDDNVDLEGLEISSEETDEDDQEATKDDAPVVKFVHKIIIDAIKKGASDIHFEPYERSYRIRYRQDGILIQVASPPVKLASRITARLKVMSSLDISERRIPQDGRFKMKISQVKSIDFRVSTCPTVTGEKVVLRILDPSYTKLGVDALGFNELQKEHFLNTITQPQGLILVTGPTGSGKTVTLYTALNILNEEERNISTSEDPVEIKVPGINQVNINLKAGLTFANALRAFLRQDPDIIMVGEVRDLETAEICVKAAQTGHMVLSTLHTNSSSETLTRLANMGVPPFNIAASVSLIIAQRLARRLCPQCREEHTGVPSDALIKQGFNEEEIKEIELYKPGGCDNCTNGYKGRIALFEVMPITKEIGQMIMDGGNSLELEKVAKDQGMETIRRSGLNFVKQGITSLEEVNRVTKD